jgi:hypothetical protein
MNGTDLWKMVYEITFTQKKGNDFYFYVTFALVVEKVITHLSPPMTFKDDEWVGGSLPIPT